MRIRVWVAISAPLLLCAWTSAAIGGPSSAEAGLGPGGPALSIPALRWILAAQSPPLAAAGDDSERLPNGEEVAAPEPGAPYLLNDQLLMQAGRPVPAGLSASRTVERQEERHAAMDRLAAELTLGSAERAAWEAYLAELLSSPEVSLDRWSAAARAVGELGLYELAPSIARELPYPGDAARALAAREALHILYVEWFDDSEAFASYAASFPADAWGSAWFERLRDQSELATQLLLRNLDLEPGRAAERLTHADSRVRARAATALSAAEAAGNLEPGEALPLLLAFLEVEADPRAFLAGLEALLGALAVGEHPAELRLRLNGILESCVRGARPGLELPVARALARLPFEGFEAGGTPAQSAQPDWSQALIAELLDGQALAGGQADPDVVVGTLGAFQALWSSARRTGVEAGLERDAARWPILAILRNPSLDEGVRAAAAAAVAVVAQPEDVRVLVEVLRGGGGRGELRFGVLGALGGVARNPELALGSEQGTLLVDALLELVADPDVDLRRRALDLLAAEELSALLAQRDLSLLLRRLENETDEVLLGRVIALVRSHGRPDMLERILGLPDVAFARLAAGNSARLAQLAGLLGELAGDRPEAVLSCARRLEEVPDEASQIRRLHSALGLVSTLSEEAAAGLSAEGHGEVVLMAAELREAGVRLAVDLPEGQRLLQRLAEVHVPGSEQASQDLGEAARNRYRALFLGDLLNGERDEELEQEVRASYARALELAEEESSPDFANRVRRDRARFLDSRERRIEALVDYRMLVFPPGVDGQTPTVPTPSAVLESSDLRAAARLLAEVQEPPAERVARLREAFDILIYLVRQREVWAREPAAQRLRDLTDLVERARELGDPERLAQVESLLMDLPEDLAALNGTAAGPEGEPDPVWQGLVGEQERLAELQALLESVREALGPRPQEPSEPELPDPGPGDAEVADDDAGGTGTGAGGRR